jgi:hypothetical protein
MLLAYLKWHDDERYRSRPVIPTIDEYFDGFEICSAAEEMMVDHDSPLDSDLVMPQLNNRSFVVRKRRLRKQSKSPGTS